MPDLVPSAGYDRERILAETFLRDVEIHESILSTNDRGLERAAEAECPLLILAEQQTSGRGRGANLWWSATGSLTFSLVVDCEQFSLSPVNRPKASLTVGLAVCDVLSTLLGSDRDAEPGGGDPPPGEDGGRMPPLRKIHVGLKWPNDVLLNGRKCCGILIEAPAAHSDRLVIGVGLNVNNSLAAAPQAIRARATSLTDEYARLGRSLALPTNEAGDTFSLGRILIGLLRQIEQDLAHLPASDKSLRDRWRRYCALRGRTVLLDVNDRHVEGTCRGIDRDGALLLKTGSGTKRFFSGVVVGIG